MTDAAGEDRWHREHGECFETRFASAPKSIYMRRLGLILESAHRRFHAEPYDSVSELQPEIQEIRSIRLDTLRWLVNDQTLPSLPHIVDKLDKIVSDPNASSQHVADVVSLDPAIATKLLAMVNSPLIGLLQKVTQVHQAVTVLGTRQVHSLVVAVSVFTAFPSRNRSSFDLRRFWKHSMSVAIGSSFIAKTLVEKHALNIVPQDAFLAGLVHDIGKILIAQVWPEKYDEIRQSAMKNETALYDAELAVLGVRHTDLGQHLLQKWNISDTIGSAVANHHEPGTGGTLAAIVHLADLVARGIGHFSDVDQMPRLDSWVFEHLGLSDEVIECVGCRVLDQVPDIESMVATLCDA